MPSIAYCPAYDKEMKELMDKLHEYWHFDRIFGGGARPSNANGFVNDLSDLSRVVFTDRLYLLVHGHGEMPLFVATKVPDGGTGTGTKKRYWSAAEMAEQLIGEGLTKGLTHIEMLVCHGGESVATIKQAKARMSMFEKFKRAIASNKNKEAESLQKEYTELMKGARSAQYTNEKQAMPLGAQLYRELQSRGFSQLTIVAYKAPVAQEVKYRGQDGATEFIPTLDLRSTGGDWGASIKSNPSLKMFVTRKLFQILGWKLNPRDASDPLACW